MRAGEVKAWGNIFSSGAQWRNSGSRRATRRRLQRKHGAEARAEARSRSPEQKPEDPRRRQEHRWSRARKDQPRRPPRFAWKPLWKTPPQDPWKAGQRCPRPPGRPPGIHRKPRDAAQEATKGTVGDPSGEILPLKPPRRHPDFTGEPQETPRRTRRKRHETPPKPRLAPAEGHRRPTGRP